MIHLTVRKTIGKQVYAFTFDGEDFFDVVMESQQLGFQDVYKCGACQSDRLYLKAYKTEKGGFEYVKIRCAGCKAQATFGKTKEDGVFFIRKKDDGSGQLLWEAYKSNGEDQGS